MQIIHNYKKRSMVLYNIIIGVYTCGEEMYVGMFMRSVHVLYA